MGNEQSVLDEETREPEKWRNKLKQHIAAHRAKAMLEKAEEEAEAVIHKQYLCENSLADQLQLNPVLTETLFSGIITACDLSYATSSIARYGTSDMQERRQEMAMPPVMKAGFNTFTSLWGFTGKHNETTDATCNVGINEDQNVVLVVFHGSLTRTWAEVLNKHGDWGADFHSDPVKAGDLKLTNIPADIEVHEGFGLNYSSVQAKLNAHLKKLLDPLPNKSSVWVIATGHSKGGAMATLAAPTIKNYLVEAGLGDVHVGLVSLSSPRVFHGKKGQRWAHNTMGMNNILRVNCRDDIATLYPTKDCHDFRHVGVHFLDNIDVVMDRQRKLYGKTVKPFTGKWYYLHHYGSYLKFGDGWFDPNLVASFSDLAAARKFAEEHARSDDGAHSTF